MKPQLSEVIHLYIGCTMSDGRILYSVDADGEWQLLTLNGGGTTNFRPEWDESVKPILHRLEDMTDEQKLYCPMISHVSKESFAVKIKKMADIINYLRSLKIDCDGLIDSGQAVDAKTLKK